MRFQQYIEFLRMRWELVAIATVAGIIVAMSLAMCTTPKFVSTAEIFLATPGYSSVGSIATSDTSPFQADVFSQQRARSYVELAGRPELASRVIDKLKIDMSPDDLAKEISARVKPDTVLIQITVKSPTPIDAKNLADAAAAELANQIRTLETPAGMRIATVDPVLTQSAYFPNGPSEPNLVEYALLGMAAGLLVGVTGAATLQGRRAFVETITLEELSGVPVLGEVHRDSDWGAVALRTRRNLVGELPVTVAVTALGGTGDGTASELASALALSGERVAYVDLKSASDSDESGEDFVGLAGVVTGERSLTDALRAGGAAEVLCLAGPGPSNLEGLLQSEGFRRTVEELRGLFDIVIFDAPNLVELTATTLLADVVDHVVIVVAEGRTRRDDLTATLDRLTVRQVCVLGTVLVPASRDVKAVVPTKITDSLRRRTIP